MSATEQSHASVAETAPPHLTVIERAVDAWPITHTGDRPASGTRWLRIAGRFSLVWFTIFSLHLHDVTSLGAALGGASLLTPIWLLAFRSVEATTHPKMAALGAHAAEMLGAVIGLLVISSLSLWVPSLQLHPLTLLGMCAAIFALTTTWDRLVDHAYPSTQKVLVVGAGASSFELIELLAATDEPFEIVGMLDDERSIDSIAGVPVLGRIADLHRVVADRAPDLVVLNVERNRPRVFSELLEVADAGFRVVGLPEFYEHVFGRVPVRHLTSAWFMSVLHLYQRPYTRLGKRSFDIVVASLGLLVTAPLFPLIALLVRLTPGSIIFRQQRLGESGTHFTILKFRTMRDGAEVPGAAVWAAHADARVTRVGRILRKTRLDELPQLWNVVRGDMSIVGPRPERPEFLAELEQAVPFWTRRHLLKPGITGWAQVRFGYAADHLGMEEKLSYDLWYLRHQSFGLDIAICAKTLPRLVLGGGAR